MGGGRGLASAETDLTSLPTRTSTSCTMGTAGAVPPTTFSHRENRRSPAPPAHFSLQLTNEAARLWVLLFARPLGRNSTPESGSMLFMVW